MEMGIRHDKLLEILQNGSKNIYRAIISLCKILKELLKNHLQQQMFYVVFKFTTVSELQSINLD
jgi:hypothetical protein